MLNAQDTRRTCASSLKGGSARPIDHQSDGSHSKQRRSFTGPVSPDGFPVPPHWWTESDTRGVLARHGVLQHISPTIIAKVVELPGSAWEEELSSYSILIVGSPLEIGEEPPEGISMLLLDGQPPLVIWLAKVTTNGNPLAIEQRLFVLPGKKTHQERVVAGLDQEHTSSHYSEIRRGIRLIAHIFPKGGRKPTPRSVKVEKLALAGLRWYDANCQAGRFVTVEDFGRPEMGEATNRGEIGVNKHMTRRPKVYNEDVWLRIHKLLEERESAR